MKSIKVTKGTGEGHTELSAFDQALFKAGIANYNLIRLSSIIPEDHEPVREQVDLNGQEFGHKLYLVYSSQNEMEPGRQAWAGIGWVMTKTDPKKGLFVEHHGNSEEEVIDLITKTLTDMKEYRPEEYGEIEYEVAGIKCEDKPVCAIVAAVYQSEDWN